jgi:hypothetical protein
MESSPFHCPRLRPVCGKTDRGRRSGLASQGCTEWTRIFPDPQDVSRPRWVRSQKRM